MRVAPPVQARSCSGGLWSWCQQALWALSAAVAAAWGALQLQLGPAQAAVAALLCGAFVALAARRLRIEPPRRLSWDGAVWTLQSGPGQALAGQAVPRVDLGGWMLVRFDPGAHWLPLARRDAGDWQALRAALLAASPPRSGA